ncbi:MAG TPA: ferritin family protein [Burkholderiales bacterium]|jgi:rubrerythrin|nr:ferritin family protein [Burkholderiales bacterium]
MPKPAEKPAEEEAYAEFMSRAYAMEIEAIERYAQFADALETHNNREVAALFRKLSEIESLHAKRILAEMRWPSPPALPAAYGWESVEGPETAPFDAVHYLMQPYHALEISLRCELQAQKYYEDIAAGAAPPRVKATAKEMAAEEAEHVALVRAWMKKVPQPTPGWDEDPDPPRTND